MSDCIIRTPWEHTTVEALNDYQTNGLLPPASCPKHPRRVRLVATQNGWVCPRKRCEFTQSWAHEFQTFPGLRSTFFWYAEDTA